MSDQVNCSACGGTHSMARAVAAKIAYAFGPIAARGSISLTGNGAACDAIVSDEMAKRAAAKANSA